MPFNTRMFDGVNILIIGSKDTIPMHIEESISEQFPALEIQTDSFENYNDALDFCKSKMNVGLLFVDEEYEGINLNDLISNLRSPYEETGLPCPVVLFHGGENPTFLGMRAMRDDHKIIGQYKEDTLISNDIKNVFPEIWQNYIECVQESILDRRVELSLRNIVQGNGRSNILQMKERLGQIISTDVNMSWQERISVRNCFLAEEIAFYDYNILKSHPGLVAIVKRYSNVPDNISLPKLINNKSVTLSGRVAGMVNHLIQKWEEGKFEEEVNFLASKNKPGCPVFIKRISRHKDTILEIGSKDTEEENNIVPFKRSA